MSGPLNLPHIELDQPGSTFYVTSVNASEIVDRVDIKRRGSTPDGIQRNQDEKRIKDIANYAKRDDAIFPTPIIISCDNSTVNALEKTIQIPEKSSIGHILDGQHRILGLRQLSKEEQSRFTLLIIFVTGTDIYSDATIFLTINSNQKPVQKSLIYDLFGIDEKRSEVKAGHEIAKALNSDPESPLFRKIKMLGRKTQETETISQAAFIDGLKPLLSPKGCFRKYYEEEKDEIITRILLNCFNALKKTFTTEWDDQGYLLSKTVGYGGIMKALPHIFKAGSQKGTLNIEFFSSIFENLKERLEKENLTLTKKDFQTSNDAMIKLSQLIIESTY
jgi:DGQHR domain-containing protein